MGWGFLDPTRLFRKSWTDAAELSMELYSMATDQTPAKMDRPVELTKQPGQPALKIVAPPKVQPQPIPLVARVKQSAVYRPGSVPDGGLYSHATLPEQPEQAPITSVPASLVSGGPTRSRSPLETGFLNIAVTAPITNLTNDVITSALSGLGARTTTPTPTPTPTPYKPRTPGYAPQPISSESVAHADPVVDVDGPVSFRGTSPVQFQSPPQVWDDSLKAYASYPPPSMMMVNRPPWLDRDTRLAYVTDMTAANLTDPSAITLGQGNALMYDDTDDGSTFVASSFNPTPVNSWLQFPWSSWALVYQMGDNWYAVPLGSLCSATGVIPGSAQPTAPWTFPMVELRHLSST